MPVCVCGWGGRRKNDFSKDSLKNRLSGAAENKFVGLPVSECHYGLGLKSFRVLHPSFSVHFLLASHQINMRLSLTSKSSQPDLLFTEITLRDLTCTTQLMRIMCFKIRLAEKLGSEGVFHGHFPRPGMSSPCFSACQTLIFFFETFLGCWTDVSIVLCFHCTW